MIFLAIILSYAGSAVAGNLTVVYEWKCGQYLWDSVADEQTAVDSGEYILENVFLADVDVFKDKVWVTTPKLMKGVPAALSTVSNETGYCGRLLKPFPDWSWHTRTDCTGITNVWRVAIDNCNRLWIMDNGLVALKKVCPASLIVFDVETHELLNKFDIPDEVLYSPTTNTFGSLGNVVVETHGSECEDTWVYMADAWGHGLLVWHNNVTWRLSSSVYAPSPDAGNFTVAGESFELDEGVVGLALSPASMKFQHRILMFKPLSSYNQFHVKVRDLHKSRDHNVSYWKSNYKLPSQSAAQGFSYRGVLFFGLVSEMSLACWNMKRPFTANNVVTVAQDDNNLQFASGLKVKRLLVRDSRAEYVWVLTNRLQKVRAGTLNSSDTNFRVLRAPVAELIKGTECHS